jgi:hypothetical protein
MDDRELTARVNNLTRNIRNNVIFIALFIVIGIAAFIFSPYAPLLIAAGSALIAAGFGANIARHKKRLKSLISHNIVRGVLSEAFELTHFAPKSYIGESAIKRSGLIQQTWNTLSGSDMVEGFYKGVRFMFSDIHLQLIVKRKNQNTKKTIFKGQWLIIEPAKDIPWGLTLRSRLAVGKRAKSDIETENIEFNKRFLIQSQDPHTAFYILTPHFMEYILGAKHKANSQIHFNFYGREVHAALYNGRDLFEPKGRNLFSKDNITALRGQMEWDVNYIKSIIDELLLNENLFNTEKEN